MSTRATPVAVVTAASKTKFTGHLGMGRAHSRCPGGRWDKQKPDRRIEFCLQRRLALRDFVARVGIRQAREDRVIDRMRTNRHAGIVHAQELCGREHEIVGQARARACDDCLHALRAQPQWQVLERRQQPVDGCAPQGIVGEVVVAQVDLAQLQATIRRSAHRLDHRVVPHPAAIEEPARDKKSGGHSEPSEDGQRDRAVVGVTVVERDGERARRQRAILEPGNRRHRD